LIPANDKRLHVNVLRAGKVYRVSPLEATLGDKGLNVARVTKTLSSHSSSHRIFGRNERE
jgi:fructose-1-phosphate kinase PfkB-like protein